MILKKIDRTYKKLVCSSYLIDVVTEERRLAQRNGKSDAYIDDIDQEMMQLRKRYLAVKSLRRIITKKTEKTEKGRMMVIDNICSDKIIAMYYRDSNEAVKRLH